MTETVELSCQCGTLKGTVTRENGKNLPHYFCYCDDCRAFARHLGQEEQALDCCGGVEVFHTVPANLVWTAGQEQLRCLKLKEKGALRWYSNCCQTPLCTVPPSEGFPFVSLNHTALADQDRKSELGPVLGRVQLKFALCAEDSEAFARIKSEEMSLLRLVGRIIGLMLGQRFRGRKQTPFFSKGQPVSEPRLLSEEERKAVY
ncbi:DUF6151 family protein [Kiloniella sp. b19]|uniref:DUF6151 family protein n=1 Tax=Kiloniella sp. GXU_MW_B19 TaxID=3141326 RepID=UPI0031E1200D